jgi:hypothetical protein
MKTRTPPLPNVGALDIPPIRENAAYVAAEAELLALEKRFAETERRRKSALALARGAKSGRSVAERAADLVRGGRVQKPNTADELAAIEEETQILRSAITEATEKLDKISVDLSFEISQKHKALYDQAMVASLRAMEDLAAAVGAAAGLIGRLRDAGYRTSSVVFPDIIPAGAMALGNPAHSGFSQSWRFKRALEEMGIV